MDTIKQMLKSKTILFAMALAGLGALQTAAPSLAAFMSPETYGIFTMIVGITVAVLRVVTTIPIAEK